MCTVFRDIAINSLIKFIEIINSNIITFITDKNLVTFFEKLAFLLYATQNQYRQQENHSAALIFFLHTLKKKKMSDIFKTTAENV